MFRVLASLLLMLPLSSCLAAAAVGATVGAAGAVVGAGAEATGAVIGAAIPGDDDDEDDEDDDD
ncbi:MAG: NF038104 family lipoprotein [Hyphomonadaceae bacterium]